MTILNEKESNAPVSRVLYPTPPCGRANGASVIYLLRRLPGGSSILPSIAPCEPYPTGRNGCRLGRTALGRWFTRTCSLQTEQPGSRLPTGGLLHRLLTLTPMIPSRKGIVSKTGRSFSSSVSYRCRQLALSPVERPVLPGLSSRAPVGTSDRPWHCFHDAKVRRRNQKAKKIFGFFSTSSYLCTQFIK